ncbi:Imm45 family immunity protein [Pseudomonas sp. K1(2024)]|uniref:Immunity protein 45 domain-containing protein n=2 Tax=Pseudomonas TaxID=286 RepID=A0AAI8PAN1_9PSED|nr:MULTISPECIES: Imm45 family immunity protein [Pseudomonas]AXO87794.1 hypothetical protein DZC75_07125 [Pseudomonas parafulva]MDO7904358.1 Imm45 family immunity protein [Pseudomonas sp. K13]
MRLVDFEGSAFFRGNVFRVRGSYPYEDRVDFMIFETQVELSRYGLIVTSGYKAGLVVVHLPDECLCLNGGVDKEWLVSNWANWVYPDCDVSEVFFLEGYVAV